MSIYGESFMHRQVDPEVVKLRVKKGAALLDEQYLQWEDAIDLETLDLSMHHRCILGQIGHDIRFGSGHSMFTDMLPVVFADWADHHHNDAAREYGFDSTGEYDSEDEYHELDIAWSALIVERMEERNTPTGVRV